MLSHGLIIGYILKSVVITFVIFSEILPCLFFSFIDSVLFNIAPLFYAHFVNYFVAFEQSLYFLINCFLFGFPP